MGSRSGTLSAAKIADKATLDQLSRILASKTFSQVERLKRFISFIVTETVAGRSGELKEYVIGVQVFAKDPSFDPRTDPIVRVQARRLRARLVTLLPRGRQGDEIAIDLPKGGYSPVFRRKESTASGRPSLTRDAGWAQHGVRYVPFADRSPEPTLDYFCRGVRDEIVHALTSIKALRVLATTGDEVDQDRTDAALLIDGSVRIAGDHARITAQLVDGTSGHYLWSESFDLALGSAVASQETVARVIAQRLQSEILETQSASGDRRSSDNLAARNLYLQGRYHLNQRTEEGLQKAVDFFEKAIVKTRSLRWRTAGLPTRGACSRTTACLARPMCGPRRRRARHRR